MKTFVSILLLLIFSPAIFACTCVTTKSYSDAEYRKMLKQVKGIFYGEVISLGERHSVEEKYPGNRKFTRIYQSVNFKVIRKWKGIDSEDISVETEAASSCQYIPKVGSRIMIYAYQNENAKIPLFINYCSVNSFDNERTKRLLGEGKIFKISQIEQARQSENDSNF